MLTVLQLTSLINFEHDFVKKARVSKEINYDSPTIVLYISHKQNTKTQVVAGKLSIISEIYYVLKY